MQKLFKYIILGGSKVLSGVTDLMVKTSISKLYKKSGQVFQLDIIFTKKNEK